MKSTAILFLFLVTLTINAQKMPSRFQNSNGKFGFKDKTGKEITSAKYDTVRNFMGGGYGVNPDGRLDEYYGGMAAVKLNNKWGFVNLKGEEQISLKFDKVSDFQHRRIAAQLKGRWGFIDALGEEKVPFKYDKVYMYWGVESYATVKLNGKWGFIDFQGNEIISLKYDSIGNGGNEYLPIMFNGYVIQFKLHGKWGYVNTKGEETTPAKYDYAGSLWSGIAAVKLNGKWGFTDGKTELVSPKYDQVSEFKNEKAKAQMNGKKYLLIKKKKKGKIVIREKKLKR